MEWTILGSGTSTGVPLISCLCKVCRSKDSKNKRLRASAWVKIKSGKFLRHILIDTSTDLRQQALQWKVNQIDAVLYTHPHADHIHGIDELRSFNYLQKGRIPVYGNSWTCEELQHKFPYIFDPEPVEGGGIPELDLHPFESYAPTIDIVGVSVIPLPVQHGSKEGIGYRIGSCAYIADCSKIPQATFDRLKELDVLILDCIRLEKHRTHFNLEQSLEAISIIKPKKAFLTHLGHDFDHKSWNTKLPQGVQLAYDGLSFSV
ncbi:MBL fold metallo-hydrolase [Bdellovibrionota bacterium FG-2]